MNFVNGFVNFLADPFAESDDATLSAWRLFLIIGLIIVLLAFWGLIFKHIRDGIG